MKDNNPDNGTIEIKILVTPSSIVHFDIINFMDSREIKYTSTPLSVPQQPNEKAQQEGKVTLKGIDNLKQLIKSNTSLSWYEAERLAIKILSFQSLPPVSQEEEGWEEGWNKLTKDIPTGFEEEKKWTDKDMKSCFEAGKIYGIADVKEYHGGDRNEFPNTTDYLQSLQNKKP